MTQKQQFTYGFAASLVIAALTVLPLNGLSLFSATGIGYLIGGALLLCLGPVAICSIPAGIHWAIWREKLNGNELAIWAIWFFSCLSLILATLSEVVMK